MPDVILENLRSCQSTLQDRLRVAPNAYSSDALQDVLSSMCDNNEVPWIGRSEKGHYKHTFKGRILKQVEIDMAPGTKVRCFSGSLKVDAQLHKISFATKPPIVPMALHAHVCSQSDPCCRCKLISTWTCSQTIWCAPVPLLFSQCFRPGLSVLLYLSGCQGCLNLLPSTTLPPRAYSEPNTGATMRRPQCVCSWLR